MCVYATSRWRSIIEYAWHFHLPDRAVVVYRAGSSEDAHHVLLRFILCMANDCFGLKRPVSMVL